MRFARNTLSLKFVSPDGMPGQKRNSLNIPLPAVLALILVFVAVLYWPVISNDFLRTWDDNRYILDNPHIKTLDGGGIAHLFTIYYDGHYHPLTLLSLAIDYQVNGDDPLVFHLTSLFLHLANTFLVFWFLYLLLNKKNKLVPLLAALLFGVATMHVESVAWASERKNVLYAFFYLSSLIAYIYYCTARRPLYLVVSVSFFLLSLLSKAMALPLCVALPVIDLYLGKDLRSKRVWLEKVPYFILAVVFGVVSVLAQKSTWGEDLSQVQYAFWERILFASWAFVNYAFKLIVPVKLSGFYPYPMETDILVILRGLFSVAVALGVVFWFIKTVRKFSIFHFGALFFIINIFLLLKLFEVPAGDYILADRYAYIPSIGLFLMVAAGFERLSGKAGNIRKVSFAGIFLLVAFSSFQTQWRVRVFENDQRFYTNVLKHYPTSRVAYTNRGALYKEKGRYRAALKDFNAAIALGDAGYREYSNRGNTYTALGEHRKALVDLERAVRLKPDDGAVLASYAFALLSTGDYRSAIDTYDRVVKLVPDRSEYFQNRGTAKYSVGDLNGAVSDFTTAANLDGRNVDAFFNRGLAWINLGRLEEAIADLQMTLSLDPDHTMAHSNLGVAYSRSGQMKLAIESYGKALALQPDFFDAYLNRGIDYFTMTAYEEALQDLDKAISINPSVGASYYFRGLVFLALNQPGACDDFQRALQRGFKQAAGQLSRHCK